MATRGTVDRGRGWALYLGLALAGVAFCAVLAARSPTAWDVDFNQFYSAGKLVGTGRLYDWDAIRRLELQHRATAVPFGRIPFFAFVFQLFSALPYGVARGLWFGVEVAALAIRAALAHGRPGADGRRDLLVGAGAHVPHLRSGLRPVPVLRRARDGAARRPR